MGAADRRRDRDRHGDAPGDPWAAPQATAMQRAIQQTRRNDPRAYRRLQVGMRLVLVAMIVVLAASILVD